MTAKEKNSSEIRERILKAARDLFSRYGFNKTTVDEIAKSARKGKATVYHYFSSKEDIFRAVVEHELEILIQGLAKVINSDRDPVSKLFEYEKSRMNILSTLILLRK
jgi:AcrR family transcriptional regulator